MNGKKGPAFWVTLVALTLSLSAWGAGQRRNQQQQQQQQQQPGQGQQGIGPQVKNKEEADAFNVLQMEQNPAKRIGGSFCCEVSGLGFRSLRSYLPRDRL